MGPGMGMGMQMRPEQRLGQTMILAPRMIQSMEILQLPIMALQERIQQELLENPFLEQKEKTNEDEFNGEFDDFSADATPPERKDVTDPRSELVIDERNGNQEDFDRFDRFLENNRDWGDHLNEEHRPSSNRVDEEGDKKHDFEQNMASRPQSLHDYLSDQLAFLDAVPEEMELARFLLTHLDENGYLSTLLDDIAHSWPERVELADLEEALHLIQKLDPAGVGARDLRECLLLQLTPETPYRDVLRALIQNHLEDIKYNRLPIIQKRTGFDLEVIQEAIEVLKRQNPRPGSQFLANNMQFVVPDIIVDLDENGEYTIRLVDDWTPNIYISKRYVELYRDKAADPEAKEYLKRKIQAAQWLMESIEQRRNTLEKVTRAIIQHQRAFLDHGPEHIEPLKMQQIADQVHVHVTTVSRAVDDKWVQTPRGVFPLKRFFGGGTKTTNGEEVAWETIKQKLLEIIANEDKSEPLSDEDLVAKLTQAGFPIKRRTVTKYRKMLKIQSSRQRKVWTK